MLVMKLLQVSRRGIEALQSNHDPPMNNPHQLPGSHSLFVRFYLPSKLNLSPPPKLCGDVLRIKMPYRCLDPGRTPCPDGLYTNGREQTTIALRHLPAGRLSNSFAAKISATSSTCRQSHMQA